MPHYGGSSAWLGWRADVVPPDGVLLGLPERSGVVVRGDGSWVSVGELPRKSPG